MKIRPGKRYVTRDGRVTGPMRRLDEPAFRRLLWEADIGKMEMSVQWFRGGVYGGAEGDLDLVAEYQEPET